MAKRADLAEQVAKLLQKLEGQQAYADHSGGQWWKGKGGGKGGQKGKGNGRGQGSGEVWEEEDWQCEKCDFGPNFRRRTVCWNCGEKRSWEGHGKGKGRSGEGGKGRGRVASPRGAGGSRPLLGGRPGGGVRNASGAGGGTLQVTAAAPTGGSRRRVKGATDEDGFTMAHGGKKRVGGGERHEAAVGSLASRWGKGQAMESTPNAGAEDSQQQKVIPIKIDELDSNCEEEEAGEGRSDDGSWHRDGEESGGHHTGDYNDELRDWEEKEESDEERLARRRREWDDAQKEVADLRRIGWDDSNGTYRFAVEKAKQAEQLWRNERGPVSVRKRQRKAREALARWEGNVKKHRMELDEFDKEAWERRQTLLDKLGAAEAKVESLQEEVEGLNREELGERDPGQGKGNTTEQARTAVVQASEELENLGGNLQATVDGLQEGTREHELLSELLAGMASAAEALDRAKWLHNKSRKGGPRDDESEADSDNETEGNNNKLKDPTGMLVEPTGGCQNEEALRAQEDARRATALQARMGHMEALQRSGDQEALAKAVETAKAEAAREATGAA